MTEGGTDGGVPPAVRLPGRRRATLLSALVWFGISYGGAIVGYVVVNALAARLLEEEFGLFVIASSAAVVVGQVGLFGAHRGGLREAARLEHDDVEGVAELRRAVRVVLLVTLPLTSLVAAAATFALVPGDTGRDRLLVATGVAALVWSSGQQKLWANYLRGFGRVRFAGLLGGRSGGALVAGLQVVAISATVVLFPGAGLAGALLATAAGFAGPVAVAWLVVSRSWRHVPVGRPTMRETGRVIKRHRHFAYSMLAGPVNAHLELWLAGALLSLAGSSLYGAANRVSLLLPVFAMSLGVVFSPMVSRHYGRDDQTLERVLRTGSTLATALTAALWVPILLAPAALLEAVFGTAYRDAAPLLVILTLGGISNVVTGLCSVVLTMSEHEAVTARVQWAAMAPRAVLGIVLGTLMGPAGLALSAAVSTVLLWATLWYLARRLTGIRTHPTLRPEPRLLLRTSA